MWVQLSDTVGAALAAVSARVLLTAKAPACPGAPPQARGWLCPLGLYTQLAPSIHAQGVFLFSSCYSAGMTKSGVQKRPEWMDKLFGLEGEAQE